MKRNLLILMVVMIGSLMLGCVADDSGDKDSPSDTTTSTTATEKNTTDGVERYGIIGEIKSIGKDNNSFMVEGDLTDESEYDKANVFIDKDTKIYMNNTLVSKVDIKAGMQVRIMFRDNIRESYPVQVYADMIYAQMSKDDSEKELTYAKEMITKLEEYEGSIIATLKSQMRAKIDDKTDVKIEDDEVTEGTEYWFLLSNNPDRADPTDMYATEITSLEYLGETEEVKLTKIEEYEGDLVVTTGDGRRAKIDEHTKMTIDKTELKLDTAYFVVIISDKIRSDPTDYYLDEIYLK